MLQGSLGIVTMAPFGAFLEAMGYPARALVDPASRRDDHRTAISTARTLAGDARVAGTSTTACGRS